MSELETYAERARKELEALKARIDASRARHQERQEEARLRPDPAEEIDWDKLYKDLQARAHEVGEYLEDLTEKLRQVELEGLNTRLRDLRRAGEERLAALRESSEHRWSELQARAESGFWDLRAVMQRIGDGVRPILGGEEGGKARYYLQRVPDGRWALLREGADAPTLLFESKKAGLKPSRRYVRDQRPSELVIRRANGTFETIHTYPA